MRFAYLAMILVACKKAEPPPPPIAPPTTRDAAVAVPDAMFDASGAAQIVDVELVQLTAATVRVSSKVANPNIRPNHLVDKNLSTAWNSVTGQLVGAWIEIRPIEGAEIHEVRLTPGFTAKGPKGEDWFTMNPRIRRMSVLADGHPQPDLYLDVDKRELQAFPIIATESIRLEVAEIVAGSRKKWREVSVSELEVWGSTPAGWTSPKPLPSIEVAVGESAESFDPCPDIDEKRAQHAEKYRNFNCDLPGCDDHDYAPLCGREKATTSGDIEPPWTASTVWCESNDEIYGPSSCSVRFARGDDEAVVKRESLQGTPRMDISIEMEEVIADSPGREVVVEIEDEYDGAQTAVCRADTFKCSELIAVPEGAKLARQAWVFR